VEESKMKLSELVARAAAFREAQEKCAKGACPRCGACLKGAERWVCEGCKAEIKAYLGEDYIDPNGPQWYAKVMRRLPLVRFSPYSW
jgi:hypothetical protein